MCVGSISPSSSEIVCGLYYCASVLGYPADDIPARRIVHGFGESLHRRTPFWVICALCASLALNRSIEDRTTTTLDLYCTVLGDTLFGCGCGCALIGQLASIWRRIVAFAPIRNCIGFSEHGCTGSTIMMSQLSAATMQTMPNEPRKRFRDECFFFAHNT